MKKLILFSILLNASLLAFPQAIHIFHDGEKTPDVVANGGIDSIYVAPKFLGATEYQQVFVTKDGEKRYDVVDSVKFNLPHLVATHHTVFVPKDYGITRVVASYQGMDEQPVLVFQDGQTKMSDMSHSIGVSGVDNWDDWDPWFGVDCWTIWNNGEGDSDARTEKWYIVSGEKRDSIIVNYSGLPFANNVYRGRLRFSGEENEYTLDTNLPDSKLNFDTEGVDWYYNEEGKPVIHFSQNDSGEKRRVNLGLSAGAFEMAYNSYFEQLGKPFVHTSEEHLAALRDFCESTDFENWGKGLNWWSNEPLWKWDHLNGDINSYSWDINDHVVELDLWGAYFPNGKIQGTIPASFEVFMDDVDGALSLCDNGLYGKIPYNIRHNKNWSKYGWNFIQQQPWLGGGFDMEDINLRIDDVKVEDFVNGTISTTYEMLKKNKITWVFNAGAVDIIKGISDERVNKYLDYCEKGFGIIATVGGFMDTPYDNYHRYVLAQQSHSGLPKSILWTKGFDKADIGMYGSMSLLDSKGNLLWYRLYDGGLPESFYINSIDSVCRKYLGEPMGHEEYVSRHYESSDYSHDGEVLTLQKASVGKGVDLVFMGDMYVDTLLVEGGQYEKDMRASMEYFFDIEPYKTLRNRFNVYAIKVVSPNGYDGLEHKLNYDNDLVFEYAQKVPNIDMDHVAITIINNNPNFSFFVSGETSMWESGASIAWIEEGGPSSIICHETGGHGIAKLLDEYIYGGYEKNHTQEGAEESFREWIKTAYHDKGWGMNISATDDPEEVPWAHFLKDERYKDEVGIYQGAWMWPEELWRPSENSVMKDASYLWFNAPSREAIYKKVMQLSEGDDWTYDYEKFVEFDTPIREAHKQAMAKARKTEGERQEIQKRRIELRPPTIYKGSWRDAGKCEKETLDNENFVQPDILQHKVERSMGIGTRMGSENQQKSLRPYIMYQGMRYDADKTDQKMFNVK